MNGNRLFIGTANTMPKGMTISQLKSDKSSETQHIRSIFKLDSFLKKSSIRLLYAQKYYEKEKHNTVPLVSEYDGLRFVFDYFQFDATEKDFTDSTALMASRLNALTTKQVKGISSGDLQKYAGIYTLEAFTLDITLELRDGSLWAVVPGQADDEFQPISENVFKVKGKQGYPVTFEMHGDKPKGFTSVQPNGTFKAVFKK